MGESLEIYIFINFRIHVINRDTHKLARISTLIKKNTIILKKITNNKKMSRACY
jgi:hypothetical protein